MYDTTADDLFIFVHVDLLDLASLQKNHLTYNDIYRYVCVAWQHKRNLLVAARMPKVGCWTSTVVPVHQYLHVLLVRQACLSFTLVWTVCLYYSQLLKIVTASLWLSVIMCCQSPKQGDLFKFGLLLGIWPKDTAHERNWIICHNPLPPDVLWMVSYWPVIPIFCVYLCVCYYGVPGQVICKGRGVQNEATVFLSVSKIFIVQNNGMYQDIKWVNINWAEDGAK